MAGRVPEHVIQQIARGADVVRLIGRYCELSKKGKNYWALCPFHKEDSPSFSLDPESGLYYCFGCKEGGNVFTFLEKMEGLSFPEALKQLAEEAGVDLRQYASSEGPSRGELTRLRELNELATTFFQKCLAKARGSERVREYLAGRSIDADSIEQWRLGYAPEGWDHLLSCATGRGYEPALAVKAGLALPRQGAPGHYDRFRNRLMFPIADSLGRTIGFGARALSPDDEPKYLNSPETPLFSKGSCFFGLAQAKESIRAGKTALVLEGYTDVIMAHQHGVREAVAVLGTALTDEHARSLSRLCERVVVVFDADEAGHRSALRSIQVLLNETVEVRVAQLPAGQDPCEFLLAEGGDAFRRRLDESQGFFEFRLEAARIAHDTSTIDGATAAFREMAEMAALVREDARRDMIVRRIAQELGVRETYAWRYMQGLRSPARRTEAGAGRSDGRLSADQALPAELLGFLLAHPPLIAEATERLDTRMLADCAEKELLTQWLSGKFDGDEGGVRGFLTSRTGEDAAAASKALAQERARLETIKAATVRERLEGYFSYLDRKRVDMAIAAATGRAESDDELRVLEERLKERDRKATQSR